MNPARWTKVQVGFFTGVNGWCALYLNSERQVAGIAILIGAWLTWLAPNSEADDAAEDEPQRLDPPDWGARI